MSNLEHFANVLERYVSRGGYTPGQLARLTSLPKMTIVSWLEGRVKKPRHWEDVAKLAAALRLTEAEATDLLQAAGYPPIAELLARTASDKELDVLRPWTASVYRQVERAPFQALADLPYFVGREQELRALKGALLNGGYVTICSLHGMGGVGKTALAARLAYDLRPHFPDGVLWARVDTSDPMSILSTFAQAYGGDVSRYADLDSRSRIVRDMLAKKRALVILDNARADEDVRPLLPATGACAVIVTTRRHDLSVASGTYQFEIGPFDPDRQEAMELFAKILSVERVTAERATFIELAEVLGRLPLAVAIAACRLAYEPNWSARDFLQRVRREKKRLDELHYGDQSVRLSLAISYAALSPDRQQFFAALGAFGGEDFSVEAVANVTRVPADEVEDRLRELHAMSLVQLGQAGRYRLHPLLRDYAREQIKDGKTFERMATYFVGYVEEHYADDNALEMEISNIVGALETAFEKNLSGLLARGVNRLYGFLANRGLYELAELHLRRAAQVVEQLGDEESLMTVLLHLGYIEQYRGNYAQAEGYLRRSLSLAHALEQPERVSAALLALGMVILRRGAVGQAVAYYHEGLALARALGLPERTSRLLNNLGIVAMRTGDPAQAEELFQESLALARQTDQYECVGSLLNNLGLLALTRGDLIRAETCFQECLVRARRIDHHEHVCIALANLGDVETQRGTYTQAAKFYQESLNLARQMGHQEIIVVLLKSLGELALQRQDYAQADVHYHAGLSLAQQIGHRWCTAEILIRRAELFLKQGELSRAHATFFESLKIVRELGAQELIAGALYGLARVEALRGHNVEARRQGMEGLAIMETIHHPMQAEVAQWLTEHTATKSAR